MVTIAHASKNENGAYLKGKKGDQTKLEVCIRQWYSRPWNVVIRFIDPDMRDRCAHAMERACANDNWGYSQADRNSGLEAARQVGYDPGLVTVPVNTDCSALVTVACIYAGIAECALVKYGNSATTSTLKGRLKATGEVEIYTTSDYVTKTDKLMRGDILLAEGHHVAVVIKADAPKKSTKEIAKEVIQGKWGNGAERKQKLQAAGYNYEEVQKAVKEMMTEKTVSDIPKYVWDYLYARIGNAYGVAGLMGNLKAESNLNPKNLQNSCEKKLGMTDDEYVRAVDNGSYKNFASDSCGFGLAQWTSSGRKQGLYDSRNNRSIGNIDVQLEFLWKELSTSYKTVLNGLKTAKTVREASDIVLTKFERPKNQGDTVKTQRATYGKEYFNKYFVV